MSSVHETIRDYTDRDLPVSIYLSVYTERLNAFLPRNIVPAVENAGLPASSIPALFSAMTNGTASALQGVPGMNDNILAALDIATKSAYVSAFRIVYLCSISFGGLSIIVAFFTQGVDKYMTSFVNKTIHKFHILIIGEKADAGNEVAV